MQSVCAQSFALHHASGGYDIPNVREPEMERRRIYYHDVLDPNVVKVHQINAAEQAEIISSRGPTCRISIVPIALVAVDSEVAQRYILAARGGRRARIKRDRSIRRTIVDAVVVGSTLDKEAGAAPQSRDAPISPGGKE